MKMRTHHLGTININTKFHITPASNVVFEILIMKMDVAKIIINHANNNKEETQNHNILSHSRSDKFTHTENYTKCLRKQKQNRKE